MLSWGERFLAEIGIRALISSPKDTKILCLQRFVRFFAYGATTLILALYLSSLGVTDERIGVFMSMTLWGDVVISLILTIIADGIGRRRMLGLGSLLMTASGVVFATCSNYWVLVLASVIGVISPSGNEIGPFRAIEESAMSQLVSSADRSSIFAWYIVCGSLGVSAGNLSIGWLLQSLQARGQIPIDSYRVVFWIYAALGLVKFALSIILSEKSELQKKDDLSPVATNGETQPLLVEQNGNLQNYPSKSAESSKSWLSSLLPSLSKESASIVFKLCLLFAIDSIASGLTPASWVAYFFNRKFHLSEGRLGTLYFVVNLISSASNLVASSIARRIGLIKTMIFTHVPASIALALIPLPSNVTVAMALLIFRACFNSMDQAPRQAFIAAAVLPGERTAVMGIVNVVKTLSQSIGPILTGALAERGKFWIAFVVAGSLKIIYDLLMLGLFLGYRTQEERAEAQLQDAASDNSDSLREGDGNVAT